MTSRTTNWIIDLSHLDLHVMCWFYQIIYPGSVWQSVTSTLWPRRRYCQGGFFRKQMQEAFKWGSSYLKALSLSSIVEKVTQYLKTSDFISSSYKTNSLQVQSIYFFLNTIYSSYQAVPSFFPFIYSALISISQSQIFLDSPMLSEQLFTAAISATFPNCDINLRMSCSVALDGGFMSSRTQ